MYSISENTADLDLWRAHRGVNAHPLCNSAAVYHFEMNLAKVLHKTDMKNGFYELLDI